VPEQLLSLIDRPAGIKDIRGESVPHLILSFNLCVRALP
jgi:hypothetical protein